MLNKNEINDLLDKIANELFYRATDDEYNALMSKIHEIRDYIKNN